MTFTREKKSSLAKQASVDDIAKYSVDIPDREVQRNLQFCILFYVECIMLCIFIATYVNTVHVCLCLFTG